MRSDHTPLPMGPEPTISYYATQTTIIQLIMRAITSKSFALQIIRWRWAVLILSLLIAAMLTSGVVRLTIDNNYQAYFSEDNPELLAFEELQNVYNKQDNLLIALAPRDGVIFTQKTLDAIEWLTEEAWQIPYSTRVDSVTNFQHTRAEGDDLVVQDLVEGASVLTDQEIDAIRQIALSEPALVNGVISPTGAVTALNVIVQPPGKTLDEGPETVRHVRQLAERFKQRYPGIDVYLSGMVMLNNAFAEASLNDIVELIPVMYAIILLVIILSLRSLWSTIAVTLVILLSMLPAMGIAGWIGVVITPPTAASPTIIMTLAVADSIHLLMTMLTLMRRNGMQRDEAIVESMRVNMGPIFLTSITTAIGFLSLNFNDAPPFRDMGNMTAIGVIIAWVLSVTFLPALLSLLPIKTKTQDVGRPHLLHGLANTAIRYKQLFFWGWLVVIAFLVAMIARIELNDDFVDYFDDSIQFRRDADFISENLTGLNQIFFSVNSGESSGINEPAFLDHLEAFQLWLEAQDEVLHVSILTDTIKRLNRNMHGDDPAWEAIPTKRALAAQYLLLFEMSLPYGLDLNNQINVDKSATKVAITLEQLTNREIRAFNTRAEKWLVDHTPEVMQAKGTGATLMFSNISKRTIDSMVFGTFIALILVSATLMLALRNLKLGLISLIPNIAPALLALGIWALWKTQLGMAGSVVFAVSLGIVVDDTVHFLSKYLRARRERNHSVSEAIHYAFSTVGLALLATTTILVAGFLILVTSSYQANEQTGQLLGLIITLALILDFTFLPALLLKLERENPAQSSPGERQ